MNVAIPDNDADCQQLVDDCARNPESNSFQYIYLLIEALNKMNRLDVAVARIQERLPMELFRVVDKTNSEVDLRHPSSLRGRLRKDGDATDMANDMSDTRRAVLHDLLFTLYARLEAIAEGHRVIHDAVTGIIQREELAEGSDLTGGFKELWKLYQSEVHHSSIAPACSANEMADALNLARLFGDGR